MSRKLYKLCGCGAVTHSVALHYSFNAASYIMPLPFLNDTPNLFLSSNLCAVHCILGVCRLAFLKFTIRVSSHRLRLTITSATTATTVTSVTSKPYKFSRHHHNKPLQTLRFASTRWHLAMLMFVY